MKSLFILLFSVFCVHKLHAQKTINETINISRLPPQGIVLDKGWKFQARDNPAFALPEHNDSTWQSFDPTKDIHDLPQIQKGIGWFRLKLQVDNNIQQSLAITIAQTGASEIYLNKVDMPLNICIVSFGILF